ncbi:MAG: hypothetical protein IJ333_09865 [Clostridia bacterium]|nr:hypothetical protein [Clostridia bacterium]
MLLKIFSKIDHNIYYDIYINSVFYKTICLYNDLCEKINLGETSVETEVKFVPHYCSHKQWFHRLIEGGLFVLELIVLYLTYLWSCSMGEKNNIPPFNESANILIEKTLIINGEKHLEIDIEFIRKKINNQKKLYECRPIIKSSQHAIIQSDDLLSNCNLKFLKSSYMKHTILLVSTFIPFWLIILFSLFQAIIGKNIFLFIFLLILITASFFLFFPLEKKTRETFSSYKEYIMKMGNSSMS